MPVSSLINESELLAQIAEGDERAFKIIYEHYYRKVYTYALRYLKSNLLAEEAVQETFLKLWKAGHKLTAINSLNDYIFILTRNHSYEQVRRDALARAADQYRAADWNETDYDTEESILLHDTRRILSEAVSKLPKQQKLVYQLCYQEGLKYEEAAERLHSFTLLNYSPS